MKRIFYLVTVSILALLLSACGNKNKTLICTNSRHDENNITTNTKITTTYNEEGKEASKIEYEITKELDKDHYDKDQADAYMLAYKNDKVCETLKKELVTQNDNVFECDIKYKDYKVTATYSYIVNKLDSDDQKVLLANTKSLADLKNHYQGIEYSCK